ncbi:hypothetical protein [Acinetobacter junii]|uniref:hypothetical protein n=1 Tax=Acinetobacter junii TaxID=40215 RepID=UPI00124DDAFC|nr:hypothetical protein [Acinetobacter junii]
MSNIKSEFDELKRFAIADILSVSGKQKTTETINMHINTIIDIAFLKGQQAQQSKVDDLQKLVDDLTELNRLKTIALQQSVNRTSPYVHEKIVALEQALKGGSDEAK